MGTQTRNQTAYIDGWGIPERQSQAAEPGKGSLQSHWGKHDPTAPGFGVYWKRGDSRYLSHQFCGDLLSTLA